MDRLFRHNYKCVYEIERGEKREKKRENEYVKKRQLYKRKTEREKQE